MTQPVEPIGQRIRRIRRSLFLTQAQVAKACDVSQSAVGQWERGECIPSLRVRAALADVLKAYPHQLFDDVEASVA